MNKNIKWIVLFLSPALLLVLAFFVFPIIFLAVVSFQEWNGISIPEFNGLFNFIKIFNDDVFRRSLLNNFIWAGSAALFQIPLATTLAFILARELRGWKFYRTIFFVPNVVSLVALSMLWKAMYNPEYGIINGIINIFNFGGDKFNLNWLGELSTALPATIISYQIYVGYFLIIILAGAMNVPKDLYEAARIDGANTWQEVVHITFPETAPIILSAATLAIAFALRQFETTLLMTGGGPANKTPVLGLFMYKKMSAYDYGLASATGVVMIVLGIVLIRTIQYIFRKYDNSNEG